ncbi:MAG TPA: phosphatidate cytidylyltransferase [Planctomycetota bacterium]|nr:phosphatidate cytidylyltransferase [Planctomycetota bacterium]
MPIPRKILIRVVGAPLLLAVLGAILYLDHQKTTTAGLSSLLVLVAILCVVEFNAMCAARGIPVARVAGLVCVAAVMIPWKYLIDIPMWMADWQTWMPFCFLLYLLCKLVFRYGVFTPEAAAMTLLGYYYISLLRFVGNPPVFPKWTAFYLLFLLATGKGSDMAAFVAGKTIGRHKMSPVVSPNKTWEGGIAGAIAGTLLGFAVLYGTRLHEKYAAVPAAALLFFALIVTIAAQVGDLVKSAFKRWAGVKDSGKLLPEFGGMLDMVDSFLIAAPVAHLGTEVLRRVFG